MGRVDRVLTCSERHRDDASMRRFENGIVFHQWAVVLLVHARLVVVVVEFLRRAADEFNAAEGREAAPVQRHDRIVQAHALVRALDRRQLLPFLWTETFACADNTIHRAVQRGHGDFLAFRAHVQATEGLDGFLQAVALLATMDVVAVGIDGRDQFAPVLEA